MRNKDKPKATFFPKLSFTASFPSLPLWRAQKTGGHHQFLTLYFCHSSLFIAFSCPTAYSSSQTAPVYPQGTLLKQQTDPPWVPQELQLLPQNQLLCRLLSTGCSFCQEPAPGNSPWAAAFLKADPLPLSWDPPWAEGWICPMWISMGSRRTTCSTFSTGCREISAPMPSTPPPSLILVSLEGLLLSCFSSLLPSLSQLLHCIFLTLS